MEVLICDDASTDDSQLIISEWIKKNKIVFSNCVFIQHSKNYGITESLNELIELAQGEVISGVASDDYILPGGIVSKTDYLLANPNLYGAFSDAIAVGLDNQVYSESIRSSSLLTAEMLQQDQILHTVISKWQEPMNLQFWRRSSFKAHGGEFEFDENIFCEDLNFALWAISKNGFGYLDRKCVAYRYRSWPQSTPGETEDDRFKKMMDMANCYKEAAKSYSYNEKRYLLLKYEYYSAIALNNFQLAIHLEKIINNECKDTILLKVLRMMGVKYYSNQ
jgi:glycosyltransferase involved in cell wall biosynthesis